jgi:predicted Holliday junction resolvase-like endonuclease
MKSSVAQAISQLQAGKFKGTCPTCSEDFHLKDSVLFEIHNAPPQEALDAIQKARDEIKLRKQEIVEEYERMSSGAQKTSHAVNIGNIVEKIIPSFPSFLHEPEDCRALFQPIDYLIFSGLSSRGIVDSLHFVEVKSGG